MHVIHFKTRLLLEKEKKIAKRAFVRKHVLSHSMSKCADFFIYFYIYDFIWKVFLCVALLNRFN